MARDELDIEVVGVSSRWQHWKAGRSKAADRSRQVGRGSAEPTGPFVGEAYADMQNGTFYSGSAFFKESHRNEGTGLVGLWDVEIRRVLQFKNAWGQICDYQAEVKITLPQGKVFDDLSSFHEGCNPNGGPAWFTFPQFGDKANHDNYPKGSLIEAYWKDNNTGGEFRKIGSQRL